MMKRILLIAALAAFSTHAAADGVLSGYACGQMPATFKVDIEVGDDSEQMLKIQKLITRVLQQKQAKVSGSANLVLAIDVLTRREGTIRQKPNLGSVSDGSREQIRAWMNVWSNKSESLIGGRKAGVVEGTADDVRVEITINDKSNGKCIWRGDSVHSGAGEDQWIFAEKSALRLIDEIGRDFRDRPFEIY
jgi:hypothetical protein